MRAAIATLLGAVFLVAAETAQEPTSTDTAKPESNPGRGSGVIFVPAFLNYCNKDKNSVVTKKEFMDCFAEFFKMVDENKDGAVTREEYDAVVKKAREAQENRLSEEFKRMDRDGDGKLSEAEWANSQFKEADKNKDNAVTLSEFIQTRMKGFFVIFIPGGFRAADANRDGKVILEEQMKRVELVFKDFDENGDGAITAADAILQGERQKREKEKSQPQSKGEESGKSTDNKNQIPQHP